MRLVTEADIVAAVLWRTAGLDRAKLADLVTRAGKLPPDLFTDHPAVVDFLGKIDATFPEDRRSGWTLMCATVAVACRESRGAVFWGAGMAVVELHRKSRQRPEKAPCDALSSLCKAFHANQPRAKPSEVFARFVQIAEFGSDDVIVDYNPDRDALIFRSDRSDQYSEETKEINRDSFCRRYRRIVEASRADIPDIRADNVRRAA